MKVQSISLLFLVLGLFISTTLAKKDVMLMPKCPGHTEGMLKSEYDANMKSLQNCFANRTKVVEVAMLFANENGEITIPIIEKVRKHFLGWKINSGSLLAESNESIMFNCNCDGIDGISAQDFLQADMTCLNNCDKLEIMQCFFGNPYPAKLLDPDPVFCAKFKYLLPG